MELTQEYFENIETWITKRLNIAGMNTTPPYILENIRSLFIDRSHRIQRLYTGNLVSEIVIQLRDAVITIDEYATN